MKKLLLLAVLLALAGCGSGVSGYSSGYNPPPPPQKSVK